jgi:hypothetical protein
MRSSFGKYIMDVAIYLRLGTIVVKINRGFGVPNK